MRISLIWYKNIQQLKDKFKSVLVIEETLRINLSKS